MKPVIGINCDYKEEGRYPYSFTYRNYIEAIIAGGGIPLLLPIIKDKNDVEQVFAKNRWLGPYGGR